MDDRDILAHQAAERSFDEVLTATPHSRPVSRVNDYAPPQAEATGEGETTAEGAENSVSLVSPFSHNTPSAPPNSRQVAISGGVSACVTSHLFSSDYNISGADYIVQFQKGVEEASKFLPQPKTSRKKSRLNAGAEQESGTKKQPAKCADVVENDELSELFERLFLSPNVVPTRTNAPDPPSASMGGISTSQKKSQHRAHSNRDRGNKYEAVDLENLLLLCFRAVAASDFRVTEKLLRQIREFSSPTGDCSQRLSHYFAEGLEARLQRHADPSHSSRPQSAECMLKIYKSLLSFCPFKKVCFHQATLYILKLAEKATTLHIIDFGILHGFQWPMVIQQLSTRPGGPPKLRITGIENPMPGRPPTDSFDQARNLVIKYCQRYNVSLEFNGVSQKWETIKIEDLKIEPDQTIVVNCLFRLERLQDETAGVNCPREVVVNLIRDIKPHMFIHGILNVPLSTPLLFTRFREALYNYAAVFDMLECVFDRDSEERMILEKDVFGWEVMNLTAFEGSHRVMRPETRKQWQVRNTKAGFKLVALQKEYVEKTRAHMQDYHEDFLLDDDGSWVLMGWKGRVLSAVSFWVPTAKLP